MKKFKSAKKRSSSRSIEFFSLTMYLLLFGMITFGVMSCSDHSRVALETEDQEAGLAAVKKLTDQADLANVAMEAKLADVRHAAVEKMTDQNLLTQLLEQTGDKYILAVCKLSIALKNAPEEHRERLRDKIIPAIKALTYPEVMHKNGEIVSIKTEWAERSRTYTWLNSRGEGTGKTTIAGEFFKCSINMVNLIEPLSYSWQTYYPATLRLFNQSPPSFWRADIEVMDLLSPAFERLPQSSLVKIALEGEDRIVLNAAVEKLNDQDLLAKIALENKYNDVRRTAKSKLTDQDLLAKIAQEDKNWPDRKIATEKLTDQDVLAKIALGDKNRNVRQAAVEKLTDQNLLARIFEEDKDKNVRKSAFGKLTDQVLLAKILKEHDKWMTRVAAAEKLTDQALLAETAQKDEHPNVRSAAAKKLTNQALLTKIAEEDENMYVRKACRERLEELRGKK